MIPGGFVLSKKQFPKLKMTGLKNILPTRRPVNTIQMPKSVTTPSQTFVMGRDLARVAVGVGWGFSPKPDVPPIPEAEEEKQRMAQEILDAHNAICDAMGAGPLKTKPEMTADEIIDAFGQMVTELNGTL